MKSRNYAFVLFFAALIFFVHLWAKPQITIGSQADPSPFSLLDLNTEHLPRGLHLPRLTTTERDLLVKKSMHDAYYARGLMIFNETTSCVEIWNGFRWISVCRPQIVQNDCVITYRFLDDWDEVLPDGRIARFMTDLIPIRDIEIEITLRRLPGKTIDEMIIVENFPPGIWEKDIALIDGQEVDCIDCDVLLTISGTPSVVDFQAEPSRIYEYIVRVVGCDDNFAGLVNIEPNKENCRIIVNNELLHQDIRECSRTARCATTCTCLELIRFQPVTLSHRYWDGNPDDVTVSSLPQGFVYVIDSQRRQVHIQRDYNIQLQPSTVPYQFTVSIRTDACSEVNFGIASEVGSIRVPVVLITLCGDELLMPIFAHYNLGGYEFETPRAMMRAWAAPDWHSGETSVTAANFGHVIGGHFQWGRRDWGHAIERIKDNEGNVIRWIRGSTPQSGASNRQVDVDGQPTVLVGTDRVPCNAWLSANWIGETHLTPGAERRTALQLWGNGHFMNQPTGSISLPRNEWGVLRTHTATGDVDNPNLVLINPLDIDDPNNYYQSTHWINPNSNPCPPGWRIPTQDEWQRLGNYICGTPDFGNTIGNQSGRWFISGTRPADFNTSTAELPPNSLRNSTNVFAEGNEQSPFIWVATICRDNRCYAERDPNWQADWNGGGTHPANKHGFAIYLRADWNDFVTANPSNWRTIDLAQNSINVPEPFLFLPANGFRQPNGTIGNFSNGGNYWTSTMNNVSPTGEIRPNGAIAFTFSNWYSHTDSRNDDPRAWGQGIRCVRDAVRTVITVPECEPGDNCGAIIGYRVVGSIPSHQMSQTDEQTLIAFTAPEGGVATVWQWQVSTSCGIVYSNIPGATSSTFEITQDFILKPELVGLWPGAFDDAEYVYFRVIMANPSGSVTTATYHIRFTRACSPITAEVNIAQIAFDGGILCHFIAVPSENILNQVRFEWTVGGALQSTTGARLELNTAPAAGTQIGVTMFAICTCDDTDCVRRNTPIATRTIQSYACQTCEQIIPPVSIAVTAGANGWCDRDRTYAIEVADDTEIVSVQWYVDGTAVEGATNPASFIHRPMTEGRIYTIGASVNVRNFCGATFTVTPEDIEVSCEVNHCPEIEPNEITPSSSVFTYPLIPEELREGRGFVHIPLTLHSGRDTILTFMTFNLGANPTMSPKEQMRYRQMSMRTPYDVSVLGGIFQWGRRDWTHADRVNTPVFGAQIPLASYNPDTNPAHRLWVANENWTTDFSPALAQAHTWANPAIPAGSYFNNQTPGKGPNDPCPEGWRVPTMHEWALLTGRIANSAAVPESFSVPQNSYVPRDNGLVWVPVGGGMLHSEHGNHPHSWTGWMGHAASGRFYVPGYAIYTSEEWFGADASFRLPNANLTAEGAPTPLMFLPAGGNRNASGAFQNGGLQGHFATAIPRASAVCAYEFTFNRQAVSFSIWGHIGRGSSVRCIADFDWEDPCEGAGGTQPCVPEDASVSIEYTDADCTFVAVPAGSFEAASFQWFVGDSTTPAGTGNTFRPATLTSGSISLRVVMSFTNSCDNLATTEYSATINITCDDNRQPIMPTINIGGANNTVCGTNVIYTAVVTNNHGATAVQWLVNGSPVAGATLNTFSRASASGESITARLTTNCNLGMQRIVYSNAITVICTPLVTEIPATVRIVPPTGGGCTFTVAHCAHALNPTFAWMVNGASSTGTTYNATINGTLNAQVTMTYTNALSGAVNQIAVYSRSFDVSCYICMPEEANVSIAATTATNVCANGTVGFAATPTLNGGTATNFEWLLNGTQSIGFGQNFTWTSPQAGTISLRMTYTDNCGVVHSGIRSTNDITIVCETPIITRLPDVVTASATHYRDLGGMNMLTRGRGYVDITVNTPVDTHRGLTNGTPITMRWMTFNLGANPTMSPKEQMAYGNPGTLASTSGSAGIGHTSTEQNTTVMGGLFQWGRRNWDHAHRRNHSGFPNQHTSTRIGSIADYVRDYPNVELRSIREFRWSNDFSTPTIAVANSWMNPAAGTDLTQIALWERIENNMGLRNQTPGRGPNDPCPPGWRVPTQFEWALLGNAGTASNTTAGQGFTTPANTAVPTTSGIVWVPVRGGQVSTDSWGNWPGDAHANRPLTGYALYTLADWNAWNVSENPNRTNMLAEGAPEPLMFLPAAGILNWSGAFNFTGSTGAYATSIYLSAGTEPRSSRMSFNTAGLSFTNAWIGEGSSVRCIYDGDLP